MASHSLISSGFCFDKAEGIKRYYHPGSTFFHIIFLSEKNVKTISELKKEKKRFSNFFSVVFIPECLILADYYIFHL